MNEVIYGMNEPNLNMNEVLSQLLVVGIRSGSLITMVAVLTKIHRNQFEVLITNEVTEHHN